MKNAVRPELGTPGNIASTWDPLTNQSARRYEPAPPEHTWELAHPADVAVFQEMRRSDGQIMSLLKALRLPIQSAAWALDTEGCRDEVVEFVRTNLGLDLPGERRQRRRRNGVVWTDHVREALLMLPFGHVFFEQVYAYRRDDNRVYLRKLALRLPTTIRRIVLARDGGLEGIVQNPPEGYVDADLDLHGIFIPVDRLVGYVLDREGADWTGNSILRTAYKNWLIRDVLMKVDAQSVERNGMGIPTFAYDPATPGAREEAERIVEEVRAGESAGVVYPVSETGASDAFKLVGVSGDVVDAVPRMKYHDQQISRSALAMVLDLGHDAGARSLGETFQSLFTNAVQAIAEDVAAVATEHIIRDLVEINYGPDEPYPVLTPGRLRDNEEITLDALASLAGAGIITPDSGLEEHVRKRTGLPESDPRGPAPVAPAQPFHASEGQQTVLERFEALAQRMADLHRGH